MLIASAAAVRNISQVLSKLAGFGLPAAAAVVSLLAAPVALAGAPPVAIASLVASNVAAAGLPFVLPGEDEKETTTAVPQVSWGKRGFARDVGVLKRGFLSSRIMGSCGWGGVDLPFRVSSETTF